MRISEFSGTNSLEAQKKYLTYNFFLKLEFRLRPRDFFISAIFLYLVEGGVQPEQFGSIPRAMWWAMATLTTVGYGDVYPITPFGKIISSIVAIVGIGIVALPAGIIAANYNNLLDKK